MLNDALLQTIWSWAWPSLCLIAWIVIVAVALRRFFPVFARLTAAEGQLDEALIARLQSMAWFGLLFTGVYVWFYLAPMPERVTQFMNDRVQPWFWYTVGLVGWIIGGVYVTRRVVAFLAERATRTHAALDDALAEAIRRPLYIMLFVVGVNLWAALVPLHEDAYTTLLLGNKGATVLVIVVFLESFVRTWILLQEAESRVLATSGGVLRTTAKIVIYALGGLTVLSAIDIDITPIIASLGIGSLAIGLALQKTLEDFLAGLLIAADQPIRVGDFVELQESVAGFVLSIGWRTVRIRTRDDQYVIVPNAQMAQATVINRSMPTSEVGFVVKLGVAFDTDLERAREVVLRVAQRLQTEHPDAVASFESRVVYAGFGASEVTMNVWMRSTSWAAHFRLQDAFVRAILPAFTAEDITIPFPMRTLEFVGDPLRVEQG
ncbi:MAG: mechanosensitive ion channel family protein [Myxococcota bacterium]